MSPPRRRFGRAFARRDVPRHAALPPRTLPTAPPPFVTPARFRRRSTGRTRRVPGRHPADRADVGFAHALP
ncbi:hypothetical protein MBEHAL_1549 [Halarchaeum acidiphilum MH1-52-1]|uniref:Uncharacterized protein n=1 Tax=Halarchaeum acidiphilum MH1-52-1 TaxID=1261545 RepID=U3A570_9EURY|nr:hypothetical protein MBEHAL_1549 [Halarchaeum acidiphilum MH1-52-1]